MFPLCLMITFSIKKNVSKLCYCIENNKLFPLQYTSTNVRKWLKTNAPLKRQVTLYRTCFLWRWSCPISSWIQCNNAVTSERTPEFIGNHGKLFTCAHMSTTFKQEKNIYLGKGALTAWSLSVPKQIPYFSQ